MRAILRTSAVAFCVFALAGAASAQRPPPPPGPQTGPARVWNDGIYVTGNPIISADLGLGGSGQFTGVIDPATNKLCYIVNAPGLEKPTAAHIHAADTGKPVVTLATPAGGTSGGCLTLAPALAKALVANPGAYYVNVHNAAMPDGAVHGTLHA